jgi:hypothetical protein
MVSQKQAEANRQNALKSTGPRSLRGKNTVRFNAVRHGLRADHVLLPGESYDALQELSSQLEAEWQPVGRTEEHYVEQMVVAQWKLLRIERYEFQFRHDRLPDALPCIEGLWRSAQRFENSFTRAQHELERLQAGRLADSDPPVEILKPENSVDPPDHRPEESQLIGAHRLPYFEKPAPEPESLRSTPDRIIPGVPIYPASNPPRLQAENPQPGSRPPTPAPR